MRREDRFVMSHRPYAVDLKSLRVEQREGAWARATIDAAWFRRRSGVTAACIGSLWDFQETDPATAIDFLAQHGDGRYGGDCRARWDGESLWCAGQDPEENARFLELLRPMLDAYPEIPDCYSGWWVF